MISMNGARALADEEITAEFPAELAAAKEEQAVALGDAGARADKLCIDSVGLPQSDPPQRSGCRGSLPHRRNA